MKKFLFPVIAAAALVCGCQTYDDSEIQSRIDDFELRLSKLESQVNDNAQGLSKIVNAVTVTSVSEITNGFKVIFSDGSSYEIVNGQNGQDGAPGQDGAAGQDAPHPPWE